MALEFQLLGVSRFLFDGALDVHLDIEFLRRFLDGCNLRSCCDRVFPLEKYEFEVSFYMMSNVTSTRECSQIFLQDSTRYRFIGKWQKNKKNYLQMKCCSVGKA